MKKRIISIALALTLLLSIGSHVTAQESSDSTPMETTSSVLTAQQVEDDNDTTAMDTTDLVPYRDGDVPAVSTVVDSITPPVSALVLCMLELDLDYDQKDESFYWNGLYYMLSLYGQMDSRADLTDDTLILPAEAVADYAAALYADFSGLPTLPEELVDRISCENGNYYLARGDAGQLTTLISSTDTQSSGNLLVSGSLISSASGDTVCTFLVELQPNDSMFGYAICDALVK